MKMLVAYIGMIGIYSLVVGCATDKMRSASPLYPTPPIVAQPPAMIPVQLPDHPNMDHEQLKLILPQTQPAIGRDNSVLRHGVKVEVGASVVISVPKKDDARNSAENLNSETSFRTAENFHVLEQFVEKGLLLSGFHVKDRSKFEAKLRDLRDADPKQWWWHKSIDGDIGQVKTELDRQLKENMITMDVYTEQLLEAREQLSDKRHGKNRDENEVNDISELIRAAQDGDVQADYILQVNNMWVDFVSSTRSINIKRFDETSTFLDKNPGLQVSEKENVHALPASINQRWMMAAFNAKLINVKTGSIDWIGEYSIDSLDVLEEGIQIMIDVRKETTNEDVLLKEVDQHNALLRKAYTQLNSVHGNLLQLSRQSAAPISYFGMPDAAEQHRAALQNKLDAAREAYDRELIAVEKIQNMKGYAVTSDWELTYLVDPPEIEPDLSVTAHRESPERLMEHFRKLGSTVTIDLISSIIETR